MPVNDPLGEKKMRPLVLIPLILAAAPCLFMAQSCGRTWYVDHYEFWPAAAEWHAAKDQGDADGMRVAYHKEKIAHCRTFDPFLFYPAWANDCN